MRKHFVLLTLALLLSAEARRRKPSINLDQDKDGLPEHLQNMKDADHSDPAADIPDVSHLLRQPGNRPGDSFQNIGAQNGPAAKGEGKGSHMWFDFVAMHDRNIQLPPIQTRPKARPIFEPPPPAPEEDKDTFFASHSFALRDEFQEKQNPVNWTTCEELRRSAKFDPEDIVNKDWVPFYLWSSNTGMRAFLHNFKYVTEGVVKRYYTKFRHNLNKTVNWLEPKLILTEGENKEYLLIAGDRKGLFYMIPNMELPEYVIKNNLLMPVMPIRLKIEDPYLLLMYCDENFAYIMAQPGQEPQNNADKKIEADASGFRGRGKPISRNIHYEKAAKTFEAERKRLMEARKFLPNDGSEGLFPPGFRDPMEPDEEVLNGPQV